MSERLTQLAEDARAVWRLADIARNEAAALRKRAAQLDSEARRLDSVAAAIADGRDVANELVA